MTDKVPEEELLRAERLLRIDHEHTTPFEHWAQLWFPALLAELRSHRAAQAAETTTGKRTRPCGCSSYDRSVAEFSLPITRTPTFAPFVAAAPPLHEETYRRIRFVSCRGCGSWWTEA